MILEDLTSKLNELEQNIFQKLDVILKLVSVNSHETELNDMNRIYFVNNQNGLNIDKDTREYTETNAEILERNDTVRRTDRGNVYTYYWKIENLQNVLYKSDMYITSPSFTVLG